MKGVAPILKATVFLVSTPVLQAPTFDLGIQPMAHFHWFNYLKTFAHS